MLHEDFIERKYYQSCPITITMKIKKTSSVSVVFKDGNQSTIEVEAWGINWVSHEVEKTLRVNCPIDAEIIKIEKTK